MKFFSLLRDSIKVNDLFYSTEMLRFDKEMEYRSVTGGLFSLGIIVAVLIGFASMIIDTLSLNTINSVQSRTKDPTPTQRNITLGSSSNFMLAISAWGANASASLRYFDVQLIHYLTSDGLTKTTLTQITLEPCRKDHWDNFPQISASYDQLSMNSWLCPPLGTNFELSGDFSSEVYQYVNISVNRCNVSLHPQQPCANDQQVADFFLKYHDNLVFNIYYTKLLINSAQRQYKSYFLETSKYIMFGSTIGSSTFLYASDYSITTDNSIWPYTSLTTDEGIFIEDKSQTHSHTTFYGSYATYFIAKSPTNYIYQRQVQKISTIFSFIGGLVSAISTALFIFKAYNTLSFEIALAISVFKPPGDSGADSGCLSMNFLRFCQFYLFEFFRKIGKPRDWPTISFLAECRQQILRQLDVKALVKRIIFLEYCMTNLFEDYQLEGLQIKKPREPADISKIREKCESLDTYEERLFLGEYFNFTENLKQQSSLVSSNQSNKSKFSQICEARKIVIQKPSQNNIIVQTIQSHSLNESPSSISVDKLFRMFNNQKNADSAAEVIKLDLQKIEKQKIACRKRQSRQDFIEDRRSTHLLLLKKDAQEGNPLSKKIWEQLQYYHSPKPMHLEDKMI